MNPFQVNELDVSRLEFIPADTDFSICDINLRVGSLLNNDFTGEGGRNGRVQDILRSEKLVYMLV